MPKRKAEDSRLPGSSKTFHAFVEITKGLLHPMNLTDVLDQILSHVEELFGYKICGVILPTEPKGTLSVAPHRGFDAKVANTSRLRVGRDGIVGQVAATGKPHYAPDVSEDPHYIEGSLSVRSQFAMPLFIDGRIIGVLDVESD